jgi:hypothetical protein
MKEQEELPASKEQRMTPVREQGRLLPKAATDKLKGCCEDDEA